MLSILVALVIAYDQPISKDDFVLVGSIPVKVTVQAPVPQVQVRKSPSLVDTRTATSTPPVIMVEVPPSILTNPVITPVTTLPQKSIQDYQVIRRYYVNQPTTNQIYWTTGGSSCSQGNCPN